MWLTAPCMGTMESKFTAVSCKLVANAHTPRLCSIFAYGQTGSGKTHTMLGDCNETSDERGIVPRLLQHVFARLETLKQSKEGWHYTVKYD